MKSIFLSCVMIFIISITAAAETITDITVFNTSSPWTTPSEDFGNGHLGVPTFLSPRIDFWLPSGYILTQDAISWTHHFTPPDMERVISAQLLLTLEDDEDGDGGQGRFSMNGYWIDAPSNHQTNEFAPSIFEVFSHTYEYSFTTNMLNWLADGTIGAVMWTWTDMPCDFYIRESRLIITLTDLEPQPPPPDPVPEPTSLLLLGTGLAGIGLAKWRRKK